MNEKYNGWINYATWRVNLEMVNGSDYLESGDVFESIIELSERIENDIRDYIEEECNNGKEGINFALSYAMAFLSDVNWYEIAEHIAGDYPELIKKD